MGSERGPWSKGERVGVGLLALARCSAFGGRAQDKSTRIEGCERESESKQITECAGHGGGFAGHRERVRGIHIIECDETLQRW